MPPRENSKEYYTHEELEVIKQKWLEDKKRIDADPAFEYYLDKDREYGRHLNNKNLQLLFRHTSRLYWNGIVRSDFFLHPTEKSFVPKVYKKIKEDGYYARSKETEKKVRVWFAHACSRQTQPQKY